MTFREVARPPDGIQQQRLEQVRTLAAEGEQWMQLHVVHRQMAERIVRRAVAAGYRGFRLPSKPGPRLAWDVASNPRSALRLARHGAPDFANLRPDDGEPVSAALRRGSDVAKALALGATAVFVGRPLL